MSWSSAVALAVHCPVAGMAEFFQEGEIVHASEDIGSGALTPTDGLPATTLFVIRSCLRRKTSKGAIARHEQMHMPCALGKTEEHYAMAMPFEGAPAAKVQVVQA